MRCVIVGFGRIAISHFFQLLGMGISKDKFLVVEKKFSIRLALKFFGIQTLDNIFKVEEKTELTSIGIICSPTSLHFEHASHLLACGVHCFVEKPLTTDERESEQLRKMAEARNLVLEVGYFYQHMPTFVELKFRLEHKKFSPNEGTIKLTSPTFSGGAFGWRDDYSRGGGVLMDLGPHAIELAMFLFGEPKSWKLLAATKKISKNVHDLIKIQFIYGNFDLYLELDWADQEARRAELTVHLSDNCSTVLTSSREMLQLDTAHRTQTTRIADLSAHVNYYLRGEEFALQAEHFLERVNKSSTLSNLHLYVATDRICSEIQLVLRNMDS